MKKSKSDSFRLESCRGLLFARLQQSEPETLFVSAFHSICTKVHTVLRFRRFYDDYW